ncbi:dCTP deaminase [Candidatus Microgenomates bacterium]|nr:MAG: dCTP deaminase [Candidatus Microgenomates bacterium]
MVLSDRDLKKLLLNGHIKISPAPDLKTQLSSCSIDLRLGNNFRVFDHSRHAFIDPFSKNGTADFTKEIKIEDDEPFIIQPSDFVLGTTLEYVEIPDDLVGRLEGRSSIGRLGIVIHSTASQIDPGWRGNIALEIANMGKMPVALYPNMRICSLSFEMLSTPTENPYYKKKNAKYAGQRGPDESKIQQENV